MDDTDLQVRLYAWRMKRGLTLEQVSEATGISRSVIGRAETGGNQISAVALLKIMAVYEVTAAQFLDGAIPKWNPPPRRGRGRPRKIPAAVAKRAGLSA